MTDTSQQVDPSPGTLRQFASLLFSRKRKFLAEGETVPHIAARLAPRVVDPEHLKRYRELTCSSEGSQLPIAYPHILASSLHLTLLGSAEFPVSVLGAVHVRNDIVQHRAIDAGETLHLSAHVEGHRQAPRGQEFDLISECACDGEVVWSEVTTFLIRSPGAERPKRARAVDNAEVAPAAVTSCSFRAPNGLGRSYGWLAGDLNPIHLSDLSARLFGFKGAIAHGMWSLARSASELQAVAGQPCRKLQISFRQPIVLPAWVTLHHWREGNQLRFNVSDTQEKLTHLSGVFEPAG
ncbi:MAG: MaoC/PaaZ C-terminal domain-containing protein [Steroidobacteraceae bacterium]